MGHQPANDDKIQSDGRKKNAALPLNEADDKGGAERYPPVRQDDAVQTPEEAKTFGSASNNPTPPADKA